MLGSANLGLRFFLELASLGAVGWWGWNEGGWLAIVLPALVAVVWGTFVSPKARVPFRPLQFVVFGAAALALGSAWSVWAGVALALVVAANLAALALP